MAQLATKIEGHIEAPISQKSDKLRLVVDNNRISSVREQIGIVAESSYQKGFINQEARDGYRDLATGTEKFKLTTEQLQKMRDDALEFEERATRIHDKIQSKINEGIASENDLEFLMEAIVGHIDFMGRKDEAERLIDEKLKRMEGYRERYDKLTNHKLVKNVDYLKIGVGQRFEIPDEEAFLEMTPKERKEYLEKAEAALKEAEKYAKIIESDEAKDLKTDYETLLNQAMTEKKIIGIHTKNEFLDGFKKVDTEDKKMWLAEFEEQMERYQTLWNDIRHSLRGPALQTMEKMRHHPDNGYKEIFTKFGRVQDAEKLRLNLEYIEALEKYRLDPEGELTENALIGDHTLGEFEAWMVDQSLPDKYDAKNKLADEMIRYKHLWNEAKNLKSTKKLNYLKSMVDDWGYTELRTQLERFKRGEPIPDIQPSHKQRILARASDDSVREAIESAGETLDMQGPTKKLSFKSALTRILLPKSGKQFDAASFEDRVRHRAIERRSRLNQLSVVPPTAPLEKSEPPLSEPVDWTVSDIQRAEPPKLRQPEPAANESAYEIRNPETKSDTTSPTVDKTNSDSALKPSVSQAPSNTPNYPPASANTSDYPTGPANDSNYSQDQANDFFYDQAASDESYSASTEADPMEELDDLEDSIQVIEAADDADWDEEDGFAEARILEEDETHRETQVVVNKEGAVEEFLERDAIHNYSGDVDGVSMVVEGDASKKEMSYQDALLMRDYLAADVEEGDEEDEN